MLIKLFRVFERVSSRLQGKGWGAATIKKEFSSASSLFDTPPSVCIDIGGNKGLYTEEILSKFPRSKIIIFEPSISNSNILHSKFSKHENITLEQKAVSSTNGKLTLYSDKEGSGLASLTKRRLEHFDISFDNTEQVSVIKFEDYWKNQLSSGIIDFVKLDIEGHELDALEGFGEALLSTKVIQFEFGGCNIDTRTYLQDFWYFFTKNNFELYRITPFGKMKIKKYTELDEVFSTTNYLSKNLSL